MTAIFHNNFFSRAMYQLFNRAGAPSPENVTKADTRLPHGSLTLTKQEKNDHDRILKGLISVAV
jgi:hypothetical protein